MSFDAHAPATFSASNDIPIPPEALRHRVGGISPPNVFLAIGQRCRDDIEAALATINVDLRACKRILDFGCGCGRTLRWCGDLALTSELYGTDVDAECVAWCKEHLPFAHASVNGYAPPLPFATNTFNCLYAISVFTHFNEPDQFRWLDEIRRVLSPGGLAVLSVHGTQSMQGQHDISKLSPEMTARVNREGFVFVPEVANTYHSQQYIFRTFSRYLTVQAYLPGAINNHHDIVILKK